MKISVVWHVDEGVDLADKPFNCDFFKNPEILPSLGDFIELYFPKAKDYVQFEVVKRIWLVDGSIQVEVVGEVPDLVMEKYQ